MTKLFRVYEWLGRLYHYILIYTKVGTQAKEYLKKRGLTDETIQTFQLGYAPLKVNQTLQFLKGKGYSFRTLAEKKVLYRHKNGKLTDPFKDRVIFPIQNYMGKVVAFGGRTMGDSKVKYYNSPDTDIFKKKDNVYGFHTAKKSIIEKGYVVVFEGYFDVITAHQCGLKNVVASLGTALTPEQALLLKSVTDKVIICFDGDESGVNASFRSANILKSVGCVTRIATIPGELDPDDFFREYGYERFKKEVIATAEENDIAYAKGMAKKYGVSTSYERFRYAYNVLNDVEGDNKDNTLKTIDDVLNGQYEVLYQKIINERRN